MYLAKYPRKILLDPMGEWSNQADAVAHTFEELQQHVRAYWRKGIWSISAMLGPEDFPDLSEWLVPYPWIEESPVYRAGGIALLVDECDLFAPQASSREDVRTIYRRGRHVGLSVISTTQRPENVSREVTAQCEQAVALYMPEPRGIDYMRRIMRLTPAQVDQWQRWCKEHPHGGLWKNLRTGLTLWLPEAGEARQDGPPERQLSLVRERDAR